MKKGKGTSKKTVAVCALVVLIAAAIIGVSWKSCSGEKDTLSEETDVEQTTLEETSRADLSLEDLGVRDEDLALHGWQQLCFGVQQAGEYGSNYTQDKEVLGILSHISSVMSRYGSQSMYGEELDVYAVRCASEELTGMAAVVSKYNGGNLLSSMIMAETNAYGVKHVTAAAILRTIFAATPYPAFPMPLDEVKTFVYVHPDADMNYISVVAYAPAREPGIANISCTVAVIEEEITSEADLENYLTRLYDNEVSFEVSSVGAAEEVDAVLDLSYKGDVVSAYDAGLELIDCQTERSEFVLKNASEFGVPAEWISILQSNAAWAEHAKLQFVVDVTNTDGFSKELAGEIGTEEILWDIAKRREVLSIPEIVLAYLYGQETLAAHSLAAMRISEPCDLEKVTAYEYFYLVDDGQEQQVKICLVIFVPTANGLVQVSGVLLDDSGMGVGLFDTEEKEMFLNLIDDREIGDAKDYLGFLKSFIEDIPGIEFVTK